MRHLIAVSALCAALASCAGGADLAVAPPESFTLTYPYGIGEGVSFPDFRAVAERAAASYVRVGISGADERFSASQEGGTREDIVNAASGVIVDADGHVITAAHIAMSTGLRAEVVTADGRRRPARILRVDPERELALLRMTPFPGMRPARFADSARLRPGEPALAIGAPGNRPGVVSVGAIRVPRMEKRIAYSPYGFDNAIALAMEIEPGHSGGPIVDRHGRLIGKVAGFALGDVSAPRYVSPRVGFGVPANDIAAYLRDAMTGRQCASAAVAAPESCAGAPAAPGARSAHPGRSSRRGRVRIGQWRAKYSANEADLLLPPLVETAAVCLNYGVGFVPVHMLRFTIATKQPAMTAQTIAATIERKEGGQRALGRIEDLAVDVMRSQFVAIVGNMAMAFTVALALGWAGPWRAARRSRGRARRTS